MEQRWLQAFNDYDHAFRVARKVWGDDAPPEVIQAAAATVLIHYAKLPGERPIAATAPAPVSKVSAPTITAAGTPQWTRPEDIDASAVTCPRCGGAMWDNREGKKNPKGPDFKCKSKECLDDKGFVTAIWVRDLMPKAGRGNGAGNGAGNRTSHAPQTGYAKSQAKNAGSFADFPEALEDDGDDLPFDRGGAAHRAPASSQGARVAPYAPTEKQLEYFRRLAASPVFSPEEQKRAMEWVNTMATRQTIKDQIDWLKRQVETRKVSAA
jgi:hypothetical protein